MLTNPTLAILVFATITSNLFIADWMINRKVKNFTLKSSVVWSLLYVGAAMVFFGYLSVYESKEAASLFLAGYTLEKTLSFDNLFMFSPILAYFAIKGNDRHKALHYGILGAVVFRLLFTYIGVESMSLFGPIAEVIFSLLIFFSIYLIVTSSDDEEDYQPSGFVKWVQERYPRFTTLFFAILSIEIADIMFSFDSVPAIIAVTKDPVLIYTSMMFAILGLRSMFFVIEALKDYLAYIDQAVIVVLAFIGSKLLVGAVFDLHIDPVNSMYIIVGILLIGALSSIVKGRKIHVDSVN